MKKRNFWEKSSGIIFRNKASFLKLFYIILALSITIFLAVQQTHYQHAAAGPTADVTVDFGNEQNHNVPISPNEFGLGYGGGFGNIINSVANFLPPAGIQTIRLDSNFPSIFPTAASATNASQQHWGVLDSFLTNAQLLHMNAIVVIAYSPSWLLPNPNPCTGVTTQLNRVAPTDVNKWAQLAATAVAHVDQKFPTVPVSYEIWNEPDGTTYMCTPGNDQTMKLTEYKAIFAAAAPLMKAQAQKDGVQIQVGGPTLAYPPPHAQMWFTSLVNDPTVAPYFDFFSYHDYITGNPKIPWNQLLGQTQSTTSGVMAEYQLISSIVRAGLQPNAATTPIYITEFNTTVVIGAEPYRNSPIYGPVWNALYIADILNSTINTTSLSGPAQSLPARMLYFTGNAISTQHCMFGKINSGMDCAQGNQPYPQYYAFRLYSDPAYLGLLNGGFMANAVSSNIPGIFVSGFYTNNNNENIVIINTSGKNYPQLTASVMNTGSVATANTYTLNQANPTISTQQTQIVPSGPGYSALVSVPAYSVVGISLTINSVTPTPSPTDTSTPSPTASPTDTSTPSPTPSPTDTSTPSPTPSPTDTSTPSPTPSPTDTSTPSPTPSPTDTSTPSPTDTSTPSPTPSPTDTSTPSPTPSPTDTSTPSPTPSPTDTSTPGPTPTFTMLSMQDWGYKRW